MPTPVLAARRRSGPPSRILAAVPSVLGIVLLVLGWTAVSGEAAFRDQQVGLNAAILGGLAVLAGCGFHLFVFRRRIQGRVAALRAAVLGDDGDEGADVLHGGLT